MDVLAVCVGGNEKGVLAFCPAHGCFIAHPVCLLGRDLSGLESLPDLIAKHIGIPTLLPARDGPVLCLADFVLFEIGRCRRQPSLFDIDSIPLIISTRVFMLMISFNCSKS